MTMEEPNCQISIMQMVRRAWLGLPSHCTLGRCRVVRMALITPLSMNMIFHSRATATLPPNRDGM